MAQTTPENLDGNDSTTPRRITVWDCYEVQYELTQPDPSHWAAIGVVTAPQCVTPTGVRAFVVGTGRSESEAICDLRSRVMQRFLMPMEIHEVFAVDWA
jgi:hypothetical protein